MEVVALIQQSTSGDKAAFDALYNKVYQDLKGMARNIRFNWRQAQTLNTTALVHEAYLKVLSAKSLTATDKLHFKHICGRAMRYVLQDYLEKKQAAKRGGGKEQIDVNEVADYFHFDQQTTKGLEGLIHSLKKLENEDETLSRVVECRYFADMTIDDTAIALDISPATVKRKWSFAKVYLTNELKKLT